LCAFPSEAKINVVDAVKIENFVEDLDAEGSLEKFRVKTDLGRASMGAKSKLQKNSNFRLRSVYLK
jgi:hypothetical protein